MAKAKLSQRFLAFVLSKSGNIGDKIYGEKKRKLISDLKGTILEIGAGTGINLKYYPPDTKIILLEPNPIMQKYIKKNVHLLQTQVKIMKGIAEKIPLKDKSVDV